MSTAYGPWATPPACNTTDECSALLTAANPIGTSLGRADCFPELKPEDASAAFGGCGCISSDGLGGNTCKEATSATPSVLACYSILIVVCGLYIFRFLPTVYQLLRHRTIWKFNAAGTTYVFAWISLVASFIVFVFYLDMALRFDELAQTGLTVMGRLQIISMAVAVLNLAAAFVEMSSSIRLISNIDRLRIPVVLLVIGISCLITFTFLFTSTEISAAIGFVVVFFLAIAGIVGPVILYVRSGQRLARANDRIAFTRSQMFRAVVVDMVLNRQAMNKLLGFSKSNGSRDTKDSKEDSRDSRETHSPAGPATRPLDKDKRSSKNLNNSHPQNSKQEAKVISFLSRAVTMGFWLSFNLFGFLISVAVAIVVSANFETGPYRSNAITNLCEGIFLITALYQVLWFLDLGYRRTILHRARVSKYRSESKDGVLNSKEDSKIDVYNTSKNHQDHSKEAVVASAV